MNILNKKFKIESFIGLSIPFLGRVKNLNNLLTPGIKEVWIGFFNTGETIICARGEDRESIEFFINYINIKFPKCSILRRRRTEKEVIGNHVWSHLAEEVIDHSMTANLVHSQYVGESEYLPHFTDKFITPIKICLFSFSCMIVFYIAGRIFS